MDQDKITRRLAGMVWEPLDVIAKWLISLGCEETYRGEHSIGFRNPYLDIFTVVDAHDDPNTRAVAMAFLTAGASWVEVYPRLQIVVNQEWEQRTKKEGQPSEDS